MNAPFFQLVQDILATFESSKEYDAIGVATF